jgi:hypothetical protein
MTADACNHPVSGSATRLCRLLLMLVLTPAALAAPVAEVIRVPEDHAILQDAIDAAAPGDVIAITGGLHDGVTIDKALSLVGSASDRPSIRRGIGAGFQEATPSITLSDAGRVVLAGLEIDPAVGGTWSNNPGAIAGSAAELLILHCEIGAYAQPTGYMLSTPAIGGFFGRMLIVDSVVVGGKLHYDGPTPSIYAGDKGGAAVSTWGGTKLTVLDATIQGADADNVVVHGDDWHCGDPGGDSGPAVLGAPELFSSNAVLASGAGATAFVHHAPPWFGPYDEICPLPVPPPLDVASQWEWDASPLAISAGGLVGGQTFSVSFGGLGPLLLLTGPPDLSAPAIGTSGALLLAPGELMIAELDVPAPVTRDVVLGPFEDFQWGQILGLQLYSPATGLTRPAFAAVLPP